MSQRFLAARASLTFGPVADKPVAGQILGVGEPVAGGTKRVAHRVVQHGHPRIGQVGALGVGSYTGAKQDLVGPDVADTGQLRLVHQGRLDLSSALTGDLPEIPCRN